MNPDDFFTRLLDKLSESQELLIAGIAYLAGRIAFLHKELREYRRKVVALLEEITDQIKKGH